MLLLPNEFKLLINDLSKLPASESLLFIKNKWPHNYYEVSSTLGKKYFEIGNYLDATKCFKSAITYKESSCQLIHDLGLSLFKLGEFKEAVEYAERLYRASPENLITTKFYLDCLLATKDAEKLNSICDSLINISDSDIKYFQSQAYRLLGDFTAAVKILKSLKEVTRDNFYEFALADAYGETDSLKSIDIYEALIRNKVQLTNIQKYNLSLHYLRSSKFDAGWKLFEYGLDKDTGVYGRKLPYNFTNTFRADKESVTESNWTMICSEQGIGDQVLFLSAIHDAIKEFPNIFFFGEQRLFPILNRSYPSLILSNNGVINGVNLFELKDKNSFGYIPLGTLLSRYRPNLQSYLDNKKAFLSIDQNIYTQFKTYLDSISNGRKIIGISWKSNVSKDLSNVKNIDFLDWLPLFDKDTLVVNLQYGDTNEQQTILNNLGLEMISFNNFDFTKELDVWLALSAACDGIVSVSTSLVHFAGSCGQYVSVVMPNFQGHWSLGLNESESLYYPNVRIFRREKFQSNSSLIISAASVIK